MKAKHLNLLIILILAALFVTTFILGCKWQEMRSERQETSDTVFNTKVDTFWKDTVIEKTKYIPKKVEIIRTDTITKDTILKVEEKLYEDTICNDKDSIILQSFISGINSNLDSTSVVWKKHKEIITNYVEITKYIEKQRKFNFGVGVGYGYGLNNKQFEPFIGIMFSYNLGF